MTQQPLPALGRALLVELEPGLDVWRRVGIWFAIRVIPGVRSIADAAAVSREYVDHLLLPDWAKTPLKKGRKR